MVTVLGRDANEALMLRTEDDAWALLANLLREDFEAPADIILGDWCKLHLYLKGENWNSSITPSIFPVFQDLQSIVHHAYAKAQYGDKNKRLTNEEKEALEIVINVSGGSSNNSTDANLTEIAKACIGKMTGKQTLLAIVVIALAYGGSAVYKAHVENLREVRVAELANEDRKAILEAMEFASEQDKEKTAMFLAALKQNAVTSAIEPEINDLHHDMIKSATKANESKINGVKLEQPIAEELVKSKREKPTPVQINGLFRVVNLDWSSPHTITLKKMEDGAHVKAVFDLAWLPEDSKHTIQAAEWNENGEKVFYAHINARITTEGKIVNADLVRVSPVTTTAENENGH